MDLVQTVRKEGSRGGVDFSWDNVKNSTRREAYLGHSLMAPVGRWQKNKDLGWYAKAEDAELTPEERAEKERKIKREELRKVKEAEEDAMAKALGLPVPDRSANTEPLGMSKEKQIEVDKALKEALGDNGPAADGLGKAARDTHDFRRSDRRRRERSRSRSRDHHRRGHGERRRERRSHSRNDRDRERRYHRHRHSRSRSREVRRDRSVDRDRWRGDEKNSRRREQDERPRSRERERRHRKNRSRSRSPYRDSEEKRQRDRR